MSRRSERIAARIAAGRRRSGDGRGIITYRRIATLPGPAPAPSPPRAVSLAVDGTPAYAYDDPGLIYNRMPNPWADGGIPGVALPTGWALLGNQSGLTTTLLASGIGPNGFTTAIIRMAGTRAGGNYPVGVFNPNANLIPSALGETWSGEIGWRVVAVASMPGATGLRVGLFECTNTNWINGGFSTSASSLGPTVWQRSRVQRTLNQATATNVRLGWQLALNGAVDGDIFDFLFEIEFPVLNKGGAYLTDSVPLATLGNRRGGLPTYGAVGPSTLGVKGDVLVGRFVAGDRLSIAGIGEYVVAADAVAVANAAVVPLASPLSDILLDGDPISAAWFNEKTLAAEITGLGERMPDGRLIQARDLFVTIPAKALPWRPANGDRIILPDGDAREVVSIAPALVDGLPISFRLQVR